MSTPTGFGLDALDALYSRVRAAACVLDPSFQDGIGGPVAIARSAGFRVVGLPALCQLGGRWTGDTLVDVRLEGPPERLEAARRMLDMR